MTADRDVLLRLDEPPAGVAFIPPPNCVDCGRFVKVADPGTRVSVEHGDYGAVYAYEFQCARCARV